MFEPDAEILVSTETLIEINRDFREAGLDEITPNTSNSRLHNTTIVALVNGTYGTPHLDIITEPNIARSVALTGKLPPMYAVKVEDAYDIGCFEQPEELAFGDNSEYNEYKMVC